MDKKSESINRVSLAKIIEAFAIRFGKHKAYSVFMNGKCDAFALALQDFLAIHGRASSMQVIERETKFFLLPDGNEEESLPPLEVDYIETNNLSHVFLFFDGEEWDIGGKNAGDRFVEAWVDDVYSETSFDFSDNDERGIDKIRTNKNEFIDQYLRKEVLSSLVSIAKDFGIYSIN